MRKINFLKMILIAALLTLLVGCDFSLDVPPHSWMIGNWKEKLGDSTLEITANKIIINYDNQEFSLGVAGAFVDVREEADSDEEYLIIYTEDGVVTKFRFTDALDFLTPYRINTMYLEVFQNDVWSASTLYKRQAD